jgi:hypothetical protein
MPSPPPKLPAQVHAKCLLQLSGFNEEFEYVDELSSTEFTGLRVVTWEQTDRQTNFAKPLGAFMQLLVLNSSNWKL